MTEADVVGILARSTDARKKEPVDGKLRAINTWSRKVRGNMRPKIKVRGNMVNFRPFFAHIPPQFFLDPIYLRKIRGIDRRKRRQELVFLIFRGPCAPNEPCPPNGPGSQTTPGPPNSPGHPTNTFVYFRQVKSRARLWKRDRPPNNLIGDKRSHEEEDP